MIIDYPVQLLPLKILGADDSVKLASPGEIFYAVVSHSKVVARADNPRKLGIAYREYVSKRCEENIVRVLSYDPPFNEVHTREAIFNVKPLGTNKREFQIGELFSLEKRVDSKNQTP